MRKRGKGLRDSGVKGLRKCEGAKVILKVEV